MKKFQIAALAGVLLSAGICAAEAQTIVIQPQERTIIHSYVVEHPDLQTGTTKWSSAHKRSSSIGKAGGSWRSCVESSSSARLGGARKTAGALGARSALPLLFH